MGHGFYGSRFFAWGNNGNRNGSGRLLLRSCSRAGPKKTGTYYRLKLESFHEYPADRSQCKRHPDVAAFSYYIRNHTLLDQLIPGLHKILPDTDIWAGRPEIFYDTDEVLQKWKLRGVMTGAGEASFYRLCAAYTSGKQEILPAVLGGAGTKRFLVLLLPFFH